MAKNKSRSVYVCQSCGTQRAKWEGRCSDCGAWNSLVEETVEKETVTTARQRGWSTGSAASETQFVTLDQNIEASKLTRAQTGFGELDRVLGGGLVEGSFILLGGDPGIGKSTLLLQMAGGLAKNDLTVLYVSGEESVSQSALRAQRLGVRSGKVHMASESNLESIRELTKSVKPDVLIVDSIQSVFLPEIDSAPGSVSQIRESAAQLMGLAKGNGIAVFLIGHVTKEGNIAGPKVLEHMVDTVLSFEGDQSHQFRLLRALKNRFGATHELGVFSMDSKGLAQVDNPSELFLEERGQKLIGSAVFSSMEGTRPLLCEIQALTNSSPMPQPRRTSLGFEVNRVHLLIAVLNKHLSMKLAYADVFINVVGGLKLIEPAADLAVAAALISTEREEEIDAKTCFFGEIGLTGEVRAVSFAEARVREAMKLGFNRFVMPASNRKHMSDFEEKIKKQIVFVRDVSDLLKIFAMRAKPVTKPAPRSRAAEV
ncbi:MAG TPA: DNA repair protein RadA [Bdellovibrionales bacterium]|nr:DNA repair protein RadA [Bdellovibrionales bacterium]